jgi:hypothetical protein
MGGREQQVTAAQAGIQFDPAYLEVLAVTMDPASPLTNVVTAPQVDNAEGTVYLRVTAGPTDELPTSEFTIAKITFRAGGVSEETETMLTAISKEDERAPNIEGIDTDPRSVETPPDFLGLGNFLVTIDLP